MKSLKRFNKTLYQLYPEYKQEFMQLEILRELHYKRRTQRINFLLSIPEDFQERFTEQLKTETLNSLRQGNLEIDHKIDWLTDHAKHLMNYLADAYLVKSAALIEGYFWSINEKNAHLIALCLRQEIETLAHSHYANFVTGNDYDPLVYPNWFWLDQLKRLVFGNKSFQDTDSSTDNINPIHVIKTIQGYDKDLIRDNEATWLEADYNMLSEIVHPNAMSHSIQFEKGQQFWKMNYMAKKKLLEYFLKLAIKVFSNTLDEIDLLHEADFETGIRSLWRRDTNTKSEK
jgi:hypothetical protein